jgi:hypothetical protein
MIGHDRALDLAATAMDFRLSPDERLSLDAHLSSCSACRIEAAGMRRDADRLRALPPVPPPAWVVHAIGRRGRPFGLVLAFALLVLSGSVAAAFAGSILQRTAPIEVTPAPGPSVAPNAYPSVLLNTAIRVTAPVIVLRQVPSTAGSEIARAPRDSILVIDGALRVRADGLDWYHAVIVPGTSVLPPLPGSPRQASAASGWVAIRSETEELVAPIAPRCPTRAGTEDVAAMLEAERLACFGGATLQLDGTFSCPSCPGAAAGVYEPAWLAASSSAALIAGPGSGTGVPLHFPPEGVAIPSEGSTISLRGHFDDAAAAGCHLSLPMPGEPGASISPVDIESVVLLCRQAFVVESYEIVGGQ